MEIAITFVCGVSFGGLLVVLVLFLARHRKMRKWLLPHAFLYTEGKLIHVSNDGRKVAFEAVLETDGEHTTISGLSEEEANAIRPLMCKPVCLYLREVAA